jgi:hypothetical protein
VEKGTIRPTPTKQTQVICSVRRLADITISVMDDTDQALLSEFAMHRSEEAFAELVNRHLDMVHSAATRLAGQGPASAEDITQQVFVELARQARRLRGACRARTVALHNHPLRRN